MEGDDTDAIKTATERLTEVSYNAFGKVYQQQAAQQQAEGNPNQGPDAGAAPNNDDNVVDADYEVVDEDQK